MTADFRNESIRKQSMITNKAPQKGVEAATQYEEPAKPVIEPQLMDTYEKIKELSDGNLEKRLFICAQIFFNQAITDGDINQALQKV